MNDAAPSPATVDADALVTSHMALVGHLVRETMSRLPAHVNRDDLTSAGLAALVQASRSYDEERGVPFTRYATTRIRGAILDELRGIDWASRSVRRRAREIDETRSRLATRARPHAERRRDRFRRWASRSRSCRRTSTTCPVPA